MNSTQKGRAIRMRTIAIISTIIAIVTWATYHRPAVERFLSPGLGTCYRCNRPWKVPAMRQTGPREWTQLAHLRFNGLIGVESHTTNYGEPTGVYPRSGHYGTATVWTEPELEGKPMYPRGCFPLCERCWSSLSASERLPYYLALFQSWEKSASVGEGTRDGQPYELHARWAEIESAVIAGR